ARAGPRRRCCGQTGTAEAIGGKSEVRPYCIVMQTVLSLGHGEFMRLGARIVIGVCILAVSAAVPPQAGDVRSFGAGYLETAMFIDNSSQILHQGAATESDQQAPLFGMETEPVIGALAAKWRAIKADI